MTCTMTYIYSHLPCLRNDVSTQTGTVGTNTILTASETSDGKFALKRTVSTGTGTEGGVKLKVDTGEKLNVHTGEKLNVHTGRQSPS